MDTLIFVYLLIVRIPLIYQQLRDNKYYTIEILSNF